MCEFSPEIYKGYIFYLNKNQLAFSSNYLQTCLVMLKKFLK